MPARSIGRWAVDHLDRRLCPSIVSLVFVVLGSAFVFAWADVVRHKPHLWLAPADVGSTYAAATQLAFGHFSAIYTPQLGHIDAFPGFLLLLAPLGALSTTFRTTLVEVSSHHRPVTHGATVLFHPSGIISVGPQLTTIRGDVYAIQPQWLQFVVPYVLVLSCAALFSFDALAERLGVRRRRRLLLNVVEAVLLWNVSVIWGHPEDAVALALATYALLLAIDRRLTGAGWLLGAAVALQPLVLLMLPILLVVAGWPAAAGMTARAVVPTLVLVAVPLAAGFKQTFQALADQRAFPQINHQTPWTALAPRIGGHGRNLTVASGPGRLVAILLACGLGAWAVRWRERPELLVWGCAVGLSLWCYTESVMTSYYIWPALALAVVVAAKCSGPRFGAAAALAAVTTVIAQWHLSWLAWWLLVIGGLTLLLAVTSRPAPAIEVAAEPSVVRVWLSELGEAQKPSSYRARSRSSTEAARRKRKRARTSRKRAVRR